MRFNVMVLLPGESEKMETDSSYSGKERIHSVIEARNEREAFAMLRTMAELRDAQLSEIIE